MATDLVNLVKKIPRNTLARYIFQVQLLVQYYKKDQFFNHHYQIVIYTICSICNLNAEAHYVHNKKIRETYNETQHKIVLYLSSGITKGKHYFKSKYIAKELGLSPKEVGTNMAILADICKELDIIRWSYSNSTTWMVTPRAI